MLILDYEHRLNSSRNSSGVEIKKTLNLGDFEKRDRLYSSRNDII